MTLEHTESEKIKTPGSTNSHRLYILGSEEIEDIYGLPQFADEDINGPHTRIYLMRSNAIFDTYFANWNLGAV